MILVVHEQRTGIAIRLHAFQGMSDLSMQDCHSSGKQIQCSPFV
jgi:hypothetical protein